MVDEHRVRIASQAMIEDGGLSGEPKASAWRRSPSAPRSTPLNANAGPRIPNIRSKRKALFPRRCFSAELFLASCGQAR